MMIDNGLLFWASLYRTLPCVRLNLTKYFRLQNEASPSTRWRDHQNHVLFSSAPSDQSPALLCTRYVHSCTHTHTHTCAYKTTWWPKKTGTLFVCFNFVRLDFVKYWPILKLFTVRIRRKLLIILSSKIPPHLKCVATLPCEISVS